MNTYSKQVETYLRKQHEQVKLYKYLAGFFLIGQGVFVAGVVITLFLPGTDLFYKLVSFSCVLNILFVLCLTKSKKHRKNIRDLFTKFDIR